MSASVLFDAPGPRARALTTVFNVLGALVLLALAGWVAYLLHLKGQWSWTLWGPVFGSEFWLYYVWPGLQNTLRSAAFATVGAVLFGVIFGMGRLSHNRVVKAVSGAVVEFFRAVPVLLLMIFLNIFLARTMPWIEDRLFMAVVAALVLYNGSVIAELVRSGVRNLPKGQGEAGLAVGLTPGQTLRSVQLPQALVAMLPALLSQLVVVLKDSALGQILGYAELLRSAQIFGSAPPINSLQALTVAAVLFIIINLLLTLLANRLARRLSSRGRPTLAPAAAGAAAVGIGATGGAAPIVGGAADGDGGGGDGAGES
ncbi:amino acid ABC transporter permease [Myceligenerans pegani]|uniref:Amino acid ABC transporter permease n=1 Tax=Myceligenerans pegani TaxID=2776917 RepID=A0ABR9MU69_9MICO|nr:amino acid ABC transporter permease [Myceligenerans sp. TRM 65318]MBE1874566.1 amino acid ABC transporter permease [Myceligenerans sp. TRM 65318]MBE3016837.1 amino acid ABC transporter permease [Myceligenerans sp. TRM 65318]